jgi:hypothetical protein
MLSRLPAWQSRLNSYLMSVASKPFSYGSLDCGIFVGDAVQAMSGVDVAADLRGTYTNRREAFASIKSICGTATMEAIGCYLAGKYGLPEVPVLTAQRGDPILLRHGQRSSLGIVALHGTEILSPYQSGILRLPLSHATRAWHLQ